MVTALREVAREFFAKKKQEEQRVREKGKVESVEDERGRMRRKQNNHDAGVIPSWRSRKELLKVLSLLRAHNRFEGDRTPLLESSKGNGHVYLPLSSLLMRASERALRDPQAEVRRQAVTALASVFSTASPLFLDAKTVTYMKRDEKEVKRKKKEAKKRAKEKQRLRKLKRAEKEKGVAESSVKRETKKKEREGKSSYTAALGLTAMLLAFPTTVPGGRGKAVSLRLAQYHSNDQAVREAFRSFRSTHAQAWPRLR